ncbi:YgzB family protein [Virgibacillus soli]|uniref:YgzB family protein n=1 Tax=Paracerasibacillus soli TaxID=480284 RepID=UPI0035EA9909
MAQQQLVYSSKINKIRSFALILIFGGILLMYVGILFKKTPWVMAIFFILGILAVVFSCVVYLWIGMFSLRAIPIICPSCNKHTKMLGRVDACMHCKQPLTLDKDLEGKEFDERYNKRKYRNVKSIEEITPDK